MRFKGYDFILKIVLLYRDLSDDDRLIELVNPNGIVISFPTLRKK